jgi:hypothetical protein
MIAGYVTYQELKLITGFTDTFLKRVLSAGKLEKKLTLFGKTHCYEKAMYNLKEVEDYIKVLIF